VLSANETAEAEADVLEAMQIAMKMAEEAAAAFGDGTYNDTTGTTVDAGLLGATPAVDPAEALPGTGPGRRLLSTLARPLRGIVSHVVRAGGRKLKQDPLLDPLADPLASPDPLLIVGEWAWGVSQGTAAWRLAAQLCSTHCQPRLPRMRPIPPTPAPHRSPADPDPATCACSPSAPAAAVPSADPLLMSPLLPTADAAGQTVIGAELPIPAVDARELRGQGGGGWG